MSAVSTIDTGEVVIADDQAGGGEARCIAGDWRGAKAGGAVHKGDSTGSTGRK